MTPGPAYSPVSRAATIAEMSAAACGIGVVTNTAANVAPSIHRSARMCVMTGECIAVGESSPLDTGDL
jgi:hypothetical protein